MQYKVPNDFTNLTLFSNKDIKNNYYLAILTLYLLQQNI
jgi:hypothetical protein